MAAIQVYEKGVSVREPVRVEIVSQAENTWLINKDLDDMLPDLRGCEFTGYTDSDGTTMIKIEFTLGHEEKEEKWSLLQFKHGRDCKISSAPGEMFL